MNDQDITSSVPYSTLPATSSGFNFAVAGSSLFLIIIIIVKSIVAEKFGHVGPDPDDEMRFVQIRDFLTGQSWYETDQYRLGLFGGTDMHWSRLPDIPIIILTKFFELFSSQETALRYAISIWPPLTITFLIIALVKGANFWVNENIAESKTPLFILVLGVVFAIAFYRFRPGAIDHHNIQIGLVALSFAFALDPTQNQKSFFISGFTAALSIAVGVEVYIFIAVICAFVALNWLVIGKEASNASIGFGVGLTLGLLIVFFLVTSPADYMQVYCDSLSRITVMAGLMGGLGLAILGWRGKQLGTIGRFTWLVILGLVCGLTLTLQAPQCLANPLAALPIEVENIWLASVNEAKPIWGNKEGRSIFLPMFLGPPLLALWLSIRSHLQNPKWSSRVLITGLLISALGLMIYQVRFYPFAYLFAMLPLAAWISRVYVWGHEKSTQERMASLRYIFCGLLSMQFIWGAPGTLLAGEVGEITKLAKEARKACYSDDVIKALSELPPGLVAATSNGGSKILLHTHHRSLSGNYHRNPQGIAMQIGIGLSDPDTAYEILREAKVDYVHFCGTSPQSETLVLRNMDGLYARLMSENIPDFLEPIGPALENGSVNLFRVK
ncbi:MAG: hypothetical protein ACPGVT_07570 [Maricaulaceae bacterium]